MVGKLLCIIWGLSGGITVSAGISAFITAMGIITITTNVVIINHNKRIIICARLRP